MLEDLDPDVGAGLGEGVGHGQAGQPLHVGEVGVLLLAVAAPEAVAAVLPPDLDLLAGELGQPGHRLHLLHGQEGQVMEPPRQQGHGLPGVGAPRAPGVPLALRPQGNEGERGGEGEEGEGRGEVGEGGEGKIRSVVVVVGKTRSVVVEEGNTRSVIVDDGDSGLSTFISLILHRLLLCPRMEPMEKPVKLLFSPILLPWLPISY